MRMRLALALVFIAVPLAAGEVPPFTVEYAYSTGTVAPAYRYSESIDISASGAGKLAAAAGYGSVEWEFSFQLTPAEREKLWKTLAEQGLFTRKWEYPDKGRSGVGGGSTGVKVVSGGRTYTVGRGVIEAQRTAAEAILEAVSKSVPPAIRTKLAERRALWQQQEKR